MGSLLQLEADALLIWSNLPAARGVRPAHAGSSSSASRVIGHSDSASPCASKRCLRSDVGFRGRTGNVSNGTNPSLLTVSGPSAWLWQRPTQCPARYSGILTRYDAAFPTVAGRCIVFT